jgi:hypothetical protein
MKAKSLTKYLEIKPRNVSLTKAEKAWVQSYASVETSRTPKSVNRIKPDHWTDHDVRRLVTSLRNEENAERRDITRHKRAMKEYLRQHKIRMCATEDNLIEALDWVRDCERTGLNQPYGTATSLNPGDKVIIAIQGHALQGRQGYVERQRGSQYLVVVETSKGTVRAFLDLWDLILVKANKFGGV